MKKIVFILIVICPVISYAQDIIVKQNGEEIESKDIEIKSESVQQKAFAQNRNSKEIITNNQQSKKVTSISSFGSKSFSLAIGYGNSYGGAGLRAQWRKNDLAYHIGAGYFPYAPILGSAGVKSYPLSEYFYIDGLLGFTGVIIERTSEGETRKNIFGFSLLVGGDWTWGKKTEYGFNLAIGYTEKLNIDEEKFSATSIAADIGFLIKF